MKTGPSRCVIGAGFFLFAVVLFCLRGEARPQNISYELRGQVIDETGQPVPRVEVNRRSDTELSQTIYTDAAGIFEQRELSEPQVHLSLSKPGFFSIDDRNVELFLCVLEVIIYIHNET